MYNNLKIYFILKMPEGPEVKLTTDFLKKHLSGKVIYSWINDFLNVEDENTLENAFPMIVGNIYCKGKNIVFMLHNEYNTFYIIHHMGLTGFWSLELYTRGPQWRWMIEAEEIKLYFYDAKRIASMYLNYDDSILASIGPDILTNDFNMQIWKKKMDEHRDMNITCFLMDQSIFSGIGNYIKSEALYYAKISPLRKVETLSENEREKLFEGVFIVSRTSYASGGIDGMVLSIYGRNDKEKTQTPDGRITYWDDEIQI